jgi:hypothetical protein
MNRRASIRSKLAGQPLPVEAGRRFFRQFSRYAVNENCDAAG